MNTTVIPVDELICQLLDAADGILAGTAAVKPIISHENFLHRDDFRRIIRAGTSISTDQPLAVIGWGACPVCPGGRADALRVLRAGHLADRRQPRRSGNPRPPAHRPGQPRHP